MVIGDGSCSILFLAKLKLANHRPISKALRNVLVGKMSKSTLPHFIF